MNDLIHTLEHTVRVDSAGVRRPFSTIQVNYGTVGKKYSVSISFSGWPTFKGSSKHGPMGAAINAIADATTRGYRFADTTPDVSESLFVMDPVTARYSKVS